MIGLICLEQVLAEDGWTVANLGADLPATDLGAWVARNEVDLVALSAMDPDGVGTLSESVAAVRGAAGERSVTVLIGGRITAQPGLAETVGADGVAHSLAEAVALAAAHRPA
jgi:methanogenic corrinoid protein MtbC1